MARGGRAPDPRSANRHPTAEWTSVEELPFDWKRAGRKLPASREWHEDTQNWFSVIAALPHATLWRDGDWRAIYDLAALKDVFYTGGSMNAAFLAEMRQRENHFGLTEEARYKNRIRYTPVEQAQNSSVTDTPSAEPLPQNVTTIASAKDRLRRQA